MKLSIPVSRSQSPYVVALKPHGGLKDTVYQSLRVAEMKVNTSGGLNSKKKGIVCYALYHLICPGDFKSETKVTPELVLSVGHHQGGICLRYC